MRSGQFPYPPDETLLGVEDDRGGAGEVHGVQRPYRCDDRCGQRAGDRVDRGTGIDAGPEVAQGHSNDLGREPAAGQRALGGREREA